MTVGEKDSEIESEQMPLVDSMKNENPEDIFREPLERSLDFSQDRREGIKNINQKINQSTYSKKDEKKLSHVLSSSKRVKSQEAYQQQV